MSHINQVIQLPGEEIFGHRSNEEGWNGWFWNQDCRSLNFKFLTFSRFEEVHNLFMDIFKVDEGEKEADQHYCESIKKSKYQKWELLVPSIQFQVEKDPDSDFYDFFYYEKEIEGEIKPFIFFENDLDNHIPINEDFSNIKEIILNFREKALKIESENGTNYLKELSERCKEDEIDESVFSNPGHPFENVKFKNMDENLFKLLIKEIVELFPNKDIRSFIAASSDASTDKRNINLWIFGGSEEPEDNSYGIRISYIEHDNGTCTIGLPNAGPKYKYSEKELSLNDNGLDIKNFIDILREYIKECEFHKNVPIISKKDTFKNRLPSHTWIPQSEVSKSDDELHMTLSNLIKINNLKDITVEHLEKFYWKIHHTFYENSENFYLYHNKSGKVIKIIDTSIPINIFFEKFNNDTKWEEDRNKDRYDEGKIVFQLSTNVPGDHNQKFQINYRNTYDKLKDQVYHGTSIFISKGTGRFLLPGKENMMSNIDEMKTLVESVK